MNVYYLCRYVDGENKQNRKAFLSAVNKIDYIIDCIINAGNTVTVVSFADSADAENKKGEFKQLKDGLFLKTFFSLGNKNVFARVIGRSLLKLSYLLYLIKTVKPGDVVLAYHSPFYLGFLKLLKRVLKCKLIIETEEIYNNVSGNENKAKKEMQMLLFADGYLFPSKLLDEIVNINKKPSVCVHGIYSIANRISTPKSDGKVHCVYAGTFDQTKGGAFAAIAAAEYLDNKYHLHILGFGTESETQNVIESIKDVSKKSNCIVTYDGCLSGDEFTSFLQNCNIGLSCQNPSGVYNDTSFPSKILTYMSNGLKVVSVRIPVVENSGVGKYVYYYDNQTPAEIASAIKAAKASEFESSNVLESLDREFSNNIKALLEC